MTLQQIKTAVEKATGINMQEKGRHRNKVLARCIYADLAYRYTTETYRRIGSEINQSHCMVLHYLKILPVHLPHEEATAKIYKTLSTKLRKQL